MSNQIAKKLTGKLLLISISLMLGSCNSQAAETYVPVEQPPREALKPTPLQSSTPSFTPSVVLTTTLAATITLTPPATLSWELSNREIKQLMQDDVNCKPPCFLGVVPEKTTLGELKNIVFRLGLPLSDYQGSVYSIGYDSDQDRTPDTQFFVQSGTVSSIEISIDPKNEFEWSIYSPTSVLKRFGVPTFVTFGLQVVHEPTSIPSKAWYLMTFYYDDLDFIIQYGLAEVTLGDLITVCPNKDMFRDTFLWLGKNPDHPPLKSQDGPLEEVASYTPESFRDYLLLGPGACFDLKASAIPIY